VIISLNLIEPLFQQILYDLLYSSEEAKILSRVIPILYISVVILNTEAETGAGGDEGGNPARQVIADKQNYNEVDYNRSAVVCEARNPNPVGFSP